MVTLPFCLDCGRETCMETRFWGCKIRKNYQKLRKWYCYVLLPLGFEYKTLKLSLDYRTCLKNLINLSWFSQLWLPYSLTVGFDGIWWDFEGKSMENQWKWLRNRQEWVQIRPGGLQNYSKPVRNLTGCIRARSKRRGAVWVGFWAERRSFELAMFRNPLETCK